MRVGLIISSLRNGGGFYQFIHLVQELKKKNHDVYIYTLEDSISSQYKDILKDVTIKKPEITPIIESKPHSQLIGSLLYLFYYITITYKLYFLIRTDNLDILNPHEWPMHWPAVLIKLTKKKPVVWMCNDVFHIPGQEVEHESRMLFVLANVLLSLFDRLVSKAVNKIIVLDSRVGAVIKNYYHTDPAIVRSGLDIHEFSSIPSQTAARSTLHLPKSSFIYLCFSIFLKHRRFEDVIEALYQLRINNPKSDVLLIIIGSDIYDPAYAHKVKSLVKSKNLEKYVQIITDYIERKKVLTYYAAADVFVYPNQKQTWGLSAIEAMASGLPCIISDQAGVHEIINGENGVVFRCKNIADLLNKMDIFLKDTEIRKKVGVSARQFVCNNFSWEKYANNMLIQFNSVLAK